MASNANRDGNFQGSEQASTSSGGATEARSALIDVWFQQNPVMNNGAFRRLKSLPTAQRDEILFALHQRFGNEFVTRGLASQLPDREPASEPGPAPGLTGSGGQLPFLDKIQASFGRHDVSKVRAHTGTEAVRATEGLGATAFATGNDVAFGRAPDLHTAAHEAAHVIQQRDGISLKRVDGGGDDPHERHADAVADAVIAGKSAEGLLDRSLGPTPAIQRKTVTAHDAYNRLKVYLVDNELPIWRAIGAYLAEASLPNPHGRLTWIQQESFKRKLLMQLESNHHGMQIGDIEALIYPKNIFQAVGHYIPETTTWSEQFGLALCQSLHASIVDSLHRLATSYLDTSDRNSGNVEIYFTDLILATRMDRFVGTAMTDARPIPLQAAVPDAAQRSAARTKPVGLRPVKIAYQGAVHPSLWNWVRAEPADATPEEVAAALWSVTGNHGEVNASYNAYLLTNAAPMFGVPKDIAARHLGVTNIPRDATAEDSKENQLVTLASSSVADDVALRQQKASDERAMAQVPAGSPAAALLAAGRPSPVAQVLLSSVGDCAMQLDFTTALLEGWGFASRLAPAARFIAAKRVMFATNAKPDDVATWHPVIDAQRDRLSRVSGSIVQVTTSAKSLGITDPAKPEAALLVQVLGLYASAAGCSHFADTSEAKLAEAQALQGSLQLLALQANQRNLVGERQQIHETFGSTPKSKAAAADSTESEQLRMRSLALQTQMINGGTIDADELDEVQLRSQEIAFKNRLVMTLYASGRLGDAARAAGDGVMAHLAAIGQSDFKGLDTALTHIRDVSSALLIHVLVTEDGVRKHQQDPTITPADRRTFRLERHTELDARQGMFNELSAKKPLADILNEASVSVKDQQFRTVCWQLATLVGIAIAAAFTGGLAAEALGGVFMGAQGVATVAELSTVARVGITVTQLALDVGINSAGQSAVQGVPLKEALLQNAIMSVASLGMFGTLAKLESAALRAEARSAAAAGQTVKAAAKFGELGALGKAMFVGKEALAITGHTIWGVAIGYAGGKIDERLFHKKDGEVAQKPSEMEVREWVMQGAATAIGRGVHAQLGDRMPSLQRLAKRSAKAQQVLLEAQRLSLLATEVERSKAAVAAAELLDQRLAFLEQELIAIEEVAKRDGDPKGEHQKSVAEIREQIAESKSQESFDSDMRLHGMQELVPGAAWKGTREQIADAIKTTEARGGKASVDAHGRTKLEVDGKEITIYQVEDSRERVSKDHLGALSDHLGAPVTIDPTLTNGVKVDKVSVKGTLGNDLQVTGIRVGPDAVVADIRAHAKYIERLTQYNGLVGKLRSLWSRFSFKGDRNPWKPGTRGHDAFEEIRKINDLIELRRSAWDPRELDIRILDSEIAFLLGRKSFYDEVLRSGEETGALGDVAPGAFGSPDIWEVTSMALSAGYKLPGPEHNAQPGWYYYRHKVEANPKQPRHEFELVRSPEAPADAPALRAKTTWDEKAEKSTFNGFEAGGERNPPTIYGDDWTPARAATDMLTNGSLGEYVHMLDEMGFATRDEVKKQLEKLIKEQRKADPTSPYDAESLRNKVKEPYTAAVETYLEGVSYERMRQLIGNLGNGDRGHLAEVWYKSKYAKNAESQVRVDDVTTDKGTQHRKIDLLDEKSMIEIKDIQGVIDHDQFNSYLTILDAGEAAGRKVNALRYVFIDPEGAIANLSFIEQKMRERGNRGLSVEYFDFNHSKKTVTNATEAKAARETLVTSRPPSQKTQK